jgi:hypothetical protein
MIEGCFSVICSYAQSVVDLANHTNRGKGCPHGDSVMIPDTVKLILVVGCIVGAAYGAVWGLANFPPEQAEVVRALPHEKLRQN